MSGDVMKEVFSNAAEAKDLREENERLKRWLFVLMDNFVDPEWWDEREEGEHDDLANWFDSVKALEAAELSKRRDEALAKLTPEDREALGLSDTN